MKRILEYIEQKKAEQDETLFLSFIRDRSIHPGLRFSFAPCMAPFVMSFADINKYVLRDESSSDDLQQIINTHTEEDDHHFGMYLKDLRTLGLNGSMDFSSALRLLWGEDRKRTRQVVYGLTALIASASPLMRMVIVEAIEAAGNVGFKRYREAAEEFREMTGQSLFYFGDVHLRLESGHAMGTVGIEQTLAEIELTPEQEAEARVLVEKVFSLFIEMGAEFMEYMQVHGDISPSTWGGQESVEHQTM